ncbi:hypothetical protein DPMN_134434 [Dreissena polymorpha]|uniref:Uncharacterized protein n=1 Tax=Dreissena polymorpha TaxID=45954 RepID=A0A9D4JDT9_DREPO|nr:hypothetical protein DPMN_134434 [Dreissena polymorpha]
MQQVPTTSNLLFTNFSNNNTPFSEILGPRNSPESMDICKCKTAVQEREQRIPSKILTYLSHLYFKVAHL